MKYLIEKRNYGSNHHGFFVNHDFPVIEQKTVGLKELKQLHNDNFKQYVVNQADSFNCLVEMVKKFPQTILSSTTFYTVTISK